MSTTTDKPALHVLGLSARGFKCIEAIDINPKDGQPLIITGDNGAGKSSILDAIYFGLTGQGPETPLKQGARKGMITLQIGNKEQSFTITRKFTAKGDNLILTGPDGASLPQAQTVLKSMFDAITVDPIAFMDMKPKDQSEALKDILGIREVVDQLAKEEKEAFEKRTGVNAKVKTLEGQVEGIKVPPGTPDEPVDVADLSKKIEEGNNAMGGVRELVNGYSTVCRMKEQKAAEVTRAAQAIKQAEETLAKAKQEHARVAKELTEAEKVMVDTEAKVKTATEEAEQLKPKIETLRQHLANAQSVNTAVNDKKRRKLLNDQLKSAQKEADDLTATIESKREAKLTAVQKAKLPVEGLAIGEDNCLLYNTIPLQDQNTATQIKVCCALAMAEKPQVRILFIREGALINRDGQQIIFDIAKENDFQVWMEQFSEEPKANAIHIVAGEVAEDNRE